MISGMSAVASWTNFFSLGPKCMTHISVRFLSSSAWAFCIGWR